METEGEKVMDSDMFTDIMIDCHENNSSPVGGKLTKHFDELGYTVVAERKGWEVMSRVIIGLKQGENIELHYGDFDEAKGISRTILNQYDEDIDDHCVWPKVIQVKCDTPLAGEAIITVAKDNFSFVKVFER